MRLFFFRQLFALLDKETAIVFDNSQEIENDPDFFQVLHISLQELPEGLQIICLSRNRPAALFKRLSLTDDLLDISNEFLRFTDNESSTFINWLNPEIDAQTSSILQLKAEGWAAALVLLAQKNQFTDVSKELPALLERQDVFSYLMAEILANMDDSCVQFLTKTSVFTQFNVTMAIALTGYRNARDVLDDLLNKNFLIDRTDDSHPVYCYHPLLRDLLQNRIKSLLTKEQQVALNRDAISILIEQNKIEEAIPFYVLLQDWKSLKPLLLEHSETLINNGRHHTVIAWIEHLPEAMLANDPWLLYWYASAIKPLDPNRTAELMDQCYRQFLSVKDSLGLYSSWQVAVEAIFISFDDNTRLEIWLQRFNELRERYPHCPSFELNIKFSVIAIQALGYYELDHPWLKKLLNISEYGFRVIPIKSIQHLVSSQLGHYYLMTNEISKLQVLKPYLLSAIDNEKLPIIPRTMNAFLAGFLNLYQGDGNAGLNYVDKAINISEQSAIFLNIPFFKLHQFSCHICLGDLVSAQNVLDNIFSDIDPKQRMVLSIFFGYTAWLYALKGQLTLALEQIEQALLLSQNIKNNVGTVIILGIKVKLLAKLEQWEEAELSCSLLADFALQSPSRLNQLEYHLSDAWIGLLSNDKSRALMATEKFFSLVSKEQIKFFPGWLPDVISPLCALAIENNIEAEFALSMMQVNTLCPPPPKHLEQWPWPLRIHCFNQLQIELNGQILKQTGKSQKKVIELLFTIITLGGKNVQGGQICDLLWPDSEGDLAQQTLNTAIFRLRKLIGKNAVLVSDGRISLNDNDCWIDVWAFDATLRELDRALQQTNNDTLVIELSNRLLHLYQGSFLKHEDSGTFKFKQEQLQNKMTRLLKRLILYHEKRQEHSRICWLLEQGLERIPKLESDYQGLIDYHQKNSNIL